MTARLDLDRREGVAGLHNETTKVKRPVFVNRQGEMQFGAFEEHLDHVFEEIKRVLEFECQQAMKEAKLVLSDDFFMVFQLMMSFVPSDICLCLLFHEEEGVFALKINFLCRFIRSELIKHNDVYAYVRVGLSEALAKWDEKIEKFGINMSGWRDLSDLSALWGLKQ